jgi:Arc/MetJ-type ribon-helix-helix transcriptional regulator
MARNKKMQIGGVVPPPNVSAAMTNQQEQATMMPTVATPPISTNMKMPYGMAKGGMMEEGGLLQEGGTVDPASGNEVPTGSMQEEVRDDIPAQLSEGEFVFPADVVRFIGLERLMKMRQAAKEGLAKMDDMGQMGNSEEATIDDGADTEFETEIDDILSEVEAEAGGKIKMPEGMR